MVNVLKFQTINSNYFTVPDNEYPDKYFSYFPMKNVCCAHLLKVPWQGTSKKYPQHMFSLRNKKPINNFWLEKKKVPYLEL